MKKLAKNPVLCLQPVPQTIVSCRDKEGRNNALVVGFTANVSLDPAMVMVGIVPSRYSHHMVSRKLFNQAIQPGEISFEPLILLLR